MRFSKQIDGPDQSSANIGQCQPSSCTICELLNSLPSTGASVQLIADTAIVLQAHQTKRSSLTLDRCRTIQLQWLACFQRP